MPKKDEIGSRMKENYEEVYKYRLTRRTPVIVRIDGRAFHTFTKGFKKPFDEIMEKSMKETMLKCCEAIQGAVLGYTQSDEISILLIDYKKLNSSAFFDYEVQKLCSVIASMATLYFNQAFQKYADQYISKMKVNELGLESITYTRVLIDREGNGATFDARCFNIPESEVTNYFYWRQVDAIRNSIEATGYAYFKKSLLQHKNIDQVKQMLSDVNVDWESFTVPQKRGSCAIRNDEEKWFIDNNIPVFKGEDRDYIESLLLPDEE